MLYEIRLCRHDELDLLKLFIEKSWHSSAFEFCNTYSK